MQHVQLPWPRPEHSMHLTHNLPIGARTFGNGRGRRGLRRRGAAPASILSALRFNKMCMPNTEGPKISKWQVETLSRFVPNAKSHLVTTIEALLAAPHRSSSGPP